MQFSLQVSGVYDDVLDAARWAEERGLASVALPDHYLMSLNPDQAAEVPAPDGFIQLAGLARDTERIGLSVIVSPITFRHPAVLAKMAVTIDRMSGGRFALGIGTGWLDKEHEVFGLPYPDMSTRFAMLEDALAYVRAMLAEEPTGHTGEFFTLEPFGISPRPIGPVPLIVGGTGRVKTPRLAGRYADEYNAYPAPPDVFRSKVATARDAAAAAGRDPDELLISSSGGVLAASTRAEYEDMLAARASEADMTIDELEAYFDHRQTPRGTYEQVAEILADMEAAGMRRFYLQLGADFDRPRTAELLDALAG
ncbi:MAG: LLM class flavin-dependent oxidoreductase [Acidimicrobiia bacterium]|nr:LLM class flavin-dependent oxidoreductase [Acidimicrobiia bacterium]